MLSPMTCDVHRRIGQRRPATAGTRVDGYALNLCAECAGNASQRAASLRFYRINTAGRQARRTR